MPCRLHSMAPGARSGRSARPRCSPATYRPTISETELLLSAPRSAAAATFSPRPLIGCCRAWKSFRQPSITSWRGMVRCGTNPFALPTVSLLSCCLLFLLALSPGGEMLGGSIVAAAVVLVWAATNFLAFSSGVVMNAAVPVAAAAVPVVFFGSLQLWSGRRQAHYFAARNELLEQFQAPAIQNWLARDPNFLAEPVRQNAAVVFIDLSGFTSLSEQLGPDETRDLLKVFHALVDKEAVACGGMITSFLGDGAMILFGLPAAATDDAARAAECALRLCSSVGRWLASLRLTTRVETRIQGWCSFRRHCCLTARRRELSSHHGDR